MLKFLQGRNQESDETLLQRYERSGDNSIVGILLKRYTEKILGVCHYYLRHEQDSQDAAMEVCEIVVRKLQQKPKINRFKDWLFIVARNYCFRKLKENQRLLEFNQEWQENSLRSDMQYESAETLYLEGEQLFEKLDEEIQQLPPQQQQCLIAFYWRGERYKEIARRLNLTEDKVRSYIQNGRRNLKNRLEAFKKGTTSWCSPPKAYEQN